MKETLDDTKQDVLHSRTETKEELRRLAKSVHKSRTETKASFKKMDKKLSNLEKRTTPATNFFKKLEGWKSKVAAGGIGTIILRNYGDDLVDIGIDFLDRFTQPKRQ